MSSSCLDDATILAVGRGTVQGAERVPIEEHVAECDECRSLVSAVARGSMLDLVAVLGDSVSPKPPSVSIPKADSAVISERVAREVRQSGIGHAAAPVAAPPSEDTDPKLASAVPLALAEDELVTTIPEPLAKANPLAASAPPVAVAPPVVSRTPEMLPTPPPPVVVPAAPLSENPFAPNRKPLWIGLALVVAAAVAALAAFR
jgi:hypothetical protein